MKTPRVLLTVFVLLVMAVPTLQGCGASLRDHRMSTHAARTNEASATPPNLTTEPPAEAPLEPPLDAVSASLLAAERVGKCTIELRTDKTEWREHEKIVGTYVIRNTAGRDVTITEAPLPSPLIRDRDGNSPAVIHPPLRPTVGFCGGIGTGPRVLPAGGVETLYFSIETDPHGQFSGLRMPPGDYTLAFQDPGGKVRARVETSPVAIRVVSRNGR